MTLSSNTHIDLIEVGPRDGLQNEAQTIPTHDKITLIDKLASCGFTTIEPTSFVSPKWVPQMADHAYLMQTLKQDSTIRYPVLVPNLQGLHQAIELNIRTIAVFTAASDAFTQKNTHCSIAESMQQIHEIIELAKQHHMDIRGYVSCIATCPYSGETNIDDIVLLSQQLLEAGCYEVSLGDTTGRATPPRVKSLLKAASNHLDIKKLAMHFHDTYGQALVNVYESLHMGITKFDCSVAGLGGCPYAPGSSGNVSSEDLVYFLENLGYSTGIDLNKLCETGRYITKILGKQTRSRVARALQFKCSS